MPGWTAPGSGHGVPSETGGLATADGGPRGASAWPDHERPDHECVDLRNPEGGVLADVLDLALDDLRSFGEDHGNRCLAQRPALRMHRRRHLDHGVYLVGRTLFLRGLFRRRHQHWLWPPAN